MRRWLIFIIPVALFVLLSSTAGIYTELLWYQTVGYINIFWKVITSQLAVSLFVAAIAFIFTLFTLYLLRRNMRRRMRGPVDESNIRYFPTSHSYMEYIDDFLSSRYVTLGLFAISLAVAVMWGIGSTGQWMNFQMYLNKTPFNLADPILNQDAGYYLFQLPFMLYLYRTFMGLFVVVLLGATGLYFLSGLLSLSAPGGRSAIAHVSGLLALVLAMKGLGYKLNIDQLVYSPRGVAFGASYTDVMASLPIFRILMLLSFVLAAGALLNIFLRRFRLTLALPAALLLLSVLAGSIYPSFIQRFSVEPNELVRETPYIENNIRFTRIGFDLDKIQEVSLGQPATLTAQTLDENEGTIDNIRLLDWRLLNQTYSQLQGIRPYYRFNDIDIDRYTIDGQLRQLMVSVREMSVQDLQDNRTWLTEHLVYTHGYGAVVSPVNRITAQGQPEFLLGDIPPRTDVEELQLSRPQIYFGELTNDYVIVNTETPEFDYPQGSQANATTVYQGTDGIKLNAFNKLMFAMRLRTANLFLADSITPESRVLIHRNIMDRVRTIAPFLTYENDPYAVIADGQIYWILDAYTTSSWFPYSEPLGTNGTNYIRNSVKVVVDAYNGTVNFYQVDMEDPVANTLGKIFPDLLKPLDQMPENLQDHLRYPEQFLLTQANVLNVYHMEDPTLFYNKEDLWKLPQEKFQNNVQTVMPYYMVMSLPGEAEGSEEFVLVLPLTPAGTAENPKHNMIAWMAARNDAENYGEIALYRFPKETVVQGPMQIEARIDQDTDISSSMTLWNQSGSQVVRGNLLVIPVGDTIMYVEPVYILASNNSLPELKRVIVATKDAVAMRPTLGEAIAAVLGRPTTPTQPGDPGEPPVADVTLKDLANRISQTYQAALQAQQNGDWAEYGRLLDQLEQLISNLQQRSDTP